MMKSIFVFLLAASVCWSATPNLGCFQLAQSAGGTFCANGGGGIVCTLNSGTTNTLAYRYIAQPPSLPATSIITPTWSTLAGNSFFGVGFMNYSGTPGGICGGGCVGKTETLVVDATSSGVNILVIQWNPPNNFIGVVASASISLSSGSPVYFKLDHTGGNLLYYYSLTGIFPGTPFYTESDTSFFSGASPPNVIGYYMRKDTSSSSTETMTVNDWSPFTCASATGANIFTILY